MKIQKVFVYNLSLLFALFFVFTLSVFSTEPVPGYRINTVLNHASDFTLTLKNIELETGPYVNYGLNYQKNFYLIKIVNKNNQELFKGKILKSYQTLPPEFVPLTTNFTPETLIPNPINLFLPYFNEAAKVQIFDENNLLKLEIILALHNLEGLQYRYAACDLCGFCSADKAPSSWESCRQCLYPNASKNPYAGDTLRINDPSSNAGPTTFPNKAYTGLGCISSSPAETTQTLLNGFFSVVGGLAFIYLLYGALVMSTSQAEPERLNHGRLIIKRAIMGLIFTLLSFFIFNFIAAGILRIPGFR